MKIWTSYFAKINELENLGFNDFIAVSGYIPAFYKKLMDNEPKKYKRIIELSPKKEWFFDWKDGKFDNNEYIKLYNETVLNKINFQDILSKLK